MSSVIAFIVESLSALLRFFFRKNEMLSRFVVILINAFVATWILTSSFSFLLSHFTSVFDSVNDYMDVVMQEIDSWIILYDMPEWLRFVCSVVDFSFFVQLGIAFIGFLLAVFELMIVGILLVVAKHVIAFLYKTVQAKIASAGVS